MQMLNDEAKLQRTWTEEQKRLTMKTAKGEKEHERLPNGHASSNGVVGTKHTHAHTLSYCLLSS